MNIAQNIPFFVVGGALILICVTIFYLMVRNNRNKNRVVVA